MNENDILASILASRRDDTLGIHMRIRWADAALAVEGFLHPGFALPPGISDTQLINLMDACGKARTRLICEMLPKREKSGG